MNLNIFVTIKVETNLIHQVFLFPSKDGFSYQIIGSASQWLIDQINIFFKNYRQGLPLPPMDSKALSPFTKKVLNTLPAIPFGETRTYGEIATQIGKPKAARAVGGALGKNPFPLFLPCHRVVSSSSIGGFSEGIYLKKILLDFENYSCKLQHIDLQYL